jgi:hypothetical protein
VCPTWAEADAGISGGGLRSSSGPGPAGDNPQQAGPPPPAHPPPPTAAGPERGLEGRPVESSPQVQSASTGGGGGCCCYCWPPQAVAPVPAPAPPPAAAAASSPPLPSPLRRLLQRPLTRPDVILPLRNPAQPSPPALPLRTPTSPKQLLIGQRGPSPQRRLADPIAYHDGGRESGRERLRPPPENCRYLQVCLRGRVTGKGASQWQHACAQGFWVS